jgi:hypothetical protein
MRLANDSPLGLTAGFYGSAAEASWFFDADRGGRDLREPAAGRDRPGPGPAISRSAAGRARARPVTRSRPFYYLSHYLREQVAHAGALSAGGHRVPQPESGSRATCATASPSRSRASPT